jgi:hypothetical protein
VMRWVWSSFPRSSWTQLTMRRLACAGLEVGGPSQFDAGGSCIGESDQHCDQPVHGWVAKYSLLLLQWLSSEGGGGSIRHKSARCSWSLPRDQELHSSSTVAKNRVAVQTMQGPEGPSGPASVRTGVNMSRRLQLLIRSWVLIGVLGLLGPVVFVLILIHRRARRVLFVPFARWLVSKLEAISESYRRWLP